VRRDQVSNAKTSMQELKKKLQGQHPLALVDDQQLRDAEVEIDKLKARIRELEAEEKATTEEATKQVDAAAAEKELASLRARIDLALRDLQGHAPQNIENLTHAPPGLPDWYWGVMLLFLITGIVAGIAIMDYRNRKRHGGFRI